MSLIIRNNPTGKNKSVESIEIISPPTKTKYKDGETINLDGMIVAKKYDDNSFEMVTDYAATPANGETYAADTIESITVTVTIDETEYTCSQNITNIPNDIAYWGTSYFSDIKTFLAACDDGVYDIKSYWSVGDERGIDYTDGYDNIFVVEDLDGTTSGGTKYHAIIGEKNSNYYNHMFNTTDYDTSGGYNGTEMKTYIDDTYYTYIPSQFRKIIKKSDHISGAGASGIQTTSGVKFILHSEKEILGKCEYSVQEEADACKQFEYFKTSSNRIKDDYWWTRSTKSNTQYQFCAINKTGDSYGAYAGLNSSGVGDGVGLGIIAFCCI